jgi:hypothetical protein
MDILNLETFFLWCFIINYSILVVWFLMLFFASNLIYTIHNKWFNIDKDKFHSINYMWMGFYKLSIFLFNLAPYIAIQMIK